TELDIACAFQLGDDGKIRCLPASIQLPLVGPYYGDADCKKRVATRSSSACTEPTQAIEQAVVSPECSSASATMTSNDLHFTVSLYELGAVFTGTTYVLQNSTCV